MAKEKRAKAKQNKHGATLATSARVVISPEAERKLRQMMGREKFYKNRLIRRGMQ